MRRVHRLTFALFLAAAMRGETVSGTVVINQKLTKKTVTPALSVYRRGPVVEPAKDTAAADPLAFERSRVAVWIEGPGPAERDGGVMQQAGRRFLPDMVVVAAGGTVSFPNMDLIFHNVFSLSAPRAFDLGYYPKGESRAVTFSKPGIVYVNCHLHPNMSAVVVVTPNRWNAKADESGHFELLDVPPGDYTIVAWHKAAGFFRRPLRILPGNNASVEFLMPLGASGQQP